MKLAVELKQMIKAGASHEQLGQWVAANADELIDTLGDLVEIPEIHLNDIVRYVAQRDAAGS